MQKVPELEHRRAELRRDIAGGSTRAKPRLRTSSKHDETERLLTAMRFNASLLEMMRITVHCAASDKRLHHRDLAQMRRACVYI